MPLNHGFHVLLGEVHNKDKIVPCEVRLKDTGLDNNQPMVVSFIDGLFCGVKCTHCQECNCPACVRISAECTSAFSSFLH